MVTSGRKWKNNEGAVEADEEKSHGEWERDERATVQSSTAKVLIDLIADIPSMSQQWAFLSMAWQGVPGVVLVILTAMYESVVAAFIAEGGLAHWLLIGAGVLQGCLAADSSSTSPRALS